MAWHKLARNEVCRVPRRVVLFGVSQGEAESGQCGAFLPPAPSWRAELYEHCRGAYFGQRAVGSLQGAGLGARLPSLLSKRYRTWLFGCDVWRSLLALGIGQLLGRAWQLKGACVLSDPPTILDVLTSGGMLRVVDTRNYWPRDRQDTPLDSLECERLRALVLPTLERWIVTDNGCWQPTCAGLAWSSYRHAHMSVRPTHHEDEGATRLERLAYYQGRCQVFRYGRVEGPVHVYDIKSCYGSIMQTEPLPYRLVKPDYGRPAADWRAGPLAPRPIAQVRVVGSPVPFPVRTTYGVRHLYGTASTVLCGPEIEYLMRSGATVAVGPCAWYATYPHLSGFASEWLERRRQARLDGDEPGESLCKMVLNSLTGKFAARKHQWVDAPDVSTSTLWGEVLRPDARTGAVETYRSLGGRHQLAAPRGEHPDACPFVSSWIASLGRVKLAGLLALCPERTVYYVDTDSIHISGDGAAALQACQPILGDVPGRLTLRGIYDGATYLAPRWYRLGPDWHRAGVPVGATEAADGTLSVPRAPRGVRATGEDGAGGRLIRWVEVNPPREAATGLTDPDGWSLPMELTEGGELAPYTGQVRSL